MFGSDGHISDAKESCDHGFVSGDQSLMTNTDAKDPCWFSELMSFAARSPQAEVPDATIDSTLTEALVTDSVFPSATTTVPQLVHPPAGSRVDGKFADSLWILARYELDFVMVKTTPWPILCSASWRL